MSRIGKDPIKIVSGVTVNVEGRNVVVKGQKGELSYEHRPEIEVKADSDAVVCKVKIETKQSNALWGMTRALINNMILGVTQGFEKKLELVGVGYRVKPISDDKISLTVGFSHPVEFSVPQGIKLEVEGNNLITVRGIDRQLVGLTAANIRKIKKPEPYKGKGIKYIDEVVRRKQGKAGKV